MANAETPLMKQYNEIKERYSDAILFFRMGDFYEMFGPDAVVASKVLQIALTTRDRGNKENALPMCGIPHFAIDNYLDKMIRAGYKVAICEQIQDPKDAIGIVKRDVVKVVTPGVYTPEDENENNFLMSVYQKNEACGYAVSDLTTGEFIVFESTKDIADEVSRFAPKEILLPASFQYNPSIIDKLNDYYLTFYDDCHFDYIEAYRALLTAFKVVSLEGYGCDAMGAAISAAGALIHYFYQCQRGNVEFKQIKILNQQDFMVIDAATWRNLEIDKNLKDGSKEGALLDVVNKTVTPMGGRLTRSWLRNILLDLTEISLRQDAIECLINEPSLIGSLMDSMKGIQDIERLTVKIALGSANARDLLALSRSIKKLPPIKESLKNIQNPRLSELMNQIDSCLDVAELIDAAIADDPPLALKDGGMIRGNFNAHIDELREISSKGKGIIASIEGREKKRTGITSLKIGYNKVFGYYIEVSKSYLSQVPSDYIRKQTLANGERYITEELKSYEDKVLGAEEKLKNLEYEVFVKLRKEIAESSNRLHQTALAIAQLDALCSLSFISYQYNYVKPRIDNNTHICITDGRHPVVEKMIQSERFVPNDLFLDPSDKNIAIITGPNMAGKSTFMRQTALIVLMAQMGCFVPAKEASLGLVDRIFTRIGASDFLAKGQSTFMVEMMETANIVNNATEKSLIILDEIGRGTSTFDGISIAWAVVEYIAKKIKARTLFATHYHELTELAMVQHRVKNLNILIREWGDEIIFLRKIQEGPADKSYGIQVARLAGLPEDIIKRSKQILSNLESSELAESGAPRPVKRRGKKQKTDVQLNLFASPEELVKEELLSLDLSELTPESAMKKLQEMRQKIIARYN